MSPRNDHKTRNLIKKRITHFVKHCELDVLGEELESVCIVKTAIIEFDFDSFEWSRLGNIKHGAECASRGHERESPMNCCSEALDRWMISHCSLTCSSECKTLDAPARPAPWTMHRSANPKARKNRMQLSYTDRPNRTSFRNLLVLCI